MRHIKKFNEMFEEKYDYEHIIRILKKSHGWGFGIISSIDDFESSEYFKDPLDDNYYAEQFHIYLTDKELDNKRTDTPHSIKSATPTSIYDKLT